jgi:hypothetical protein
MEKLDKERYLKRVIVVCWIALSICFGIKLFGGNLFEIMCNNENFIKVCEYADNHFWASYLVYFIHCYISLYFLVLAMIGEWKYKRYQIIIFTLTIALTTYVKLISNSLGLVFDIWQGVLMPFVFVWNNKKRIIQIVFGNVALVVFQLLSMFVKKIKIDVVTNNGVLITIIYSFDILLMIMLYYLYSNIIRKEK